MKQIIAMHGWSGDSNTWLEWEKYFQSCGWFWESGERGYGTKRQFDPLWRQCKTKNIEHIRAVICHSLGTHLIKKETFEDADSIVLIGSFSNFIPKGIKCRLLKTALKQMQDALGTAKEQPMLEEFLSKALIPHEPKTIYPGPIQNGLSIEGRQQLLEDLRLLRQTSGLPLGIPRKAKVLVIQGAEDAIVLPSATDQLLKDLRKHLHKEPSHWIIPGEGHIILKPGLINRVENWLVEINANNK